jgi:hypothetical protein
MLKQAFSSVIFKIFFVCVLAAFIFYGLGSWIESLVGKAPVCQTMRA